MTIDVSRPERSVELTLDARGDEVPPYEAAVLASLRPRLTPMVPDQDVERLVHEALLSLGPVRVTTFLPILVERRVRQALRATV